MVYIMIKRLKKKKGAKVKIIGDPTESKLESKLEPESELGLELGLESKLGIEIGIGIRS